MALATGTMTLARETHATVVHLIDQFREAIDAMIAEADALFASSSSGGGEAASAGPVPTADTSTAAALSRTLANLSTVTRGLCEMARFFEHVREATSVDPTTKGSWMRVATSRMELMIAEQLRQLVPLALYACGVFSADAARKKSGSSELTMDTAHGRVVSACSALLLAHPEMAIMNGAVSEDEREAGAEAWERSAEEIRGLLIVVPILQGTETFTDTSKPLLSSPSNSLRRFLAERRHWRDLRERAEPSAAPSTSTAEPTPSTPPRAPTQPEAPGAPIRRSRHARRTAQQQLRQRFVADAQLQRRS